MINSIKKLSNRLNRNYNSGGINEETESLNKSGERDLNRSNVGYLVVSLLFSCISEKDIKLREVNSFLKATFDFYHLSNYQINQLYETHPQSNYLYQKQQQKITREQQLIQSRNRKDGIISNPSSPIKSSKSTNINNSNNNNTSTTKSILNITYDFELYNKQFIDRLSSFSNDSEKVLKEIQEFCTTLKRDLKIFMDNQQESSGDEEVTDLKFEKFIESKSDVYQDVMGNFQTRLIYLFPKDDPTAMNEAIESLVLIQTYGQIFPINKSRDQQLKKILNYSKSQPLKEYSDLDQDKLKLVNWDAVITDLSLINLFETPRDKILCILRSCRHISKGLSKSGKEGPGADEFIGYLIHLVIQTNPSYLYSNLKFIELFRHGCMVSEEGYYFISLKMATEYIESKFKDQYLIDSNNGVDDGENNNVILTKSTTTTTTTTIDSSITTNNEPIESPILIKQSTTTTTTTSKINLQVSNDPLINNQDGDGNSDDEYYQYEPIDDSDELLIQDIVDRSDEILKNITSLAITSGYDSYVRSALKRFAMKLSPSTLGLKLLLLENNLGQKLLSEIQQQQIENDKKNGNNKSSNEKEKEKNDDQVISTATDSTIKKNILNVFERSRSNHRILKVTLATIAGGGLLALTGGLVAAPLIGAVALHSAIGVSILSAISMTGISGTAVTSVLFGTAGATILGGRMKKITNGLKEFSFQRVNGSIGLNVVIGVLGWVQDKSGNDDQTRWESNLFSGVLCLGEVYSLCWETKLLHSLYKLLNDYKLKVEDNSSFSRFTTKMMQNAILPSRNLIEASSLISNCWSKVKDRSEKAGKLMAEEIIQCNSFGKRPITLVGISMGCNVIYHCLLELVDKKAYGHIENVLFIGAPVENSPDAWRKIRKLVSGRVVNCYSSSDLLLSFVYESNKSITEQSICCGNGPINKENNNNNGQDSKFPFKFNNNNNAADISKEDINSFSINGDDDNNSNNNIQTPKIQSFSNFNKKNIKGSELKRLYNNKTKFYLEQIEDVDVSSAITSHLDYNKDHIQRMILSHVNIESIETCPSTLMVSPNTILLLEEMKLQQQNNNNNNNNDESDSDDDSDSDSDNESKIMKSPKSNQSVIPKDDEEMVTLKEDSQYTIDDVPLSRMKF